jgi:bisanhydrobacterioruberin hydratase
MFYQKRTVFLISVLFFASSFFMSLFSDIPSFTSISSIFIIFFAIPSYNSLVSHLGYRKGLLVITLLSILPVLIEGFAVWTGFPYGGFEYGSRLGWLLFGLVPPTVSFAYLPILLSSLYIASNYTKNLVSFSIVATIFNLLVDLVIDPAAVHIGFWSYTEGGIYFGVPLSNFIGWLVTGAIYSVLFYLISGKDSLPLPSGTSVSLIWILSFWTGYLLIEKLFLPAIVGLTLVTYLITKYRKISKKKEG